MMLLIRKSQMGFDFDAPKHDELRTVHAGTRHMQSGATVQVAEHQRHTKVAEKHASKPIWDTEASINDTKDIKRRLVAAGFSRTEWKVRVSLDRRTQGYNEAEISFHYPLDSKQIVARTQSLLDAGFDVHWMVSGKLNYPIVLSVGRPGKVKIFDAERPVGSRIIGEYATAEEARAAISSPETDPRVSQADQEYTEWQAGQAGPQWNTNFSDKTTLEQPLTTNKSNHRLEATIQPNITKLRYNWSVKERWTEDGTPKTVVHVVSFAPTIEEARQQAAEEIRKKKEEIESRKKLPAYMHQVSKSIQHLPTLIKARALHGSIDFNGLQISIETGRSRVRKWHNPHDDTQGMSRMCLPYGYIKGAVGRDGDATDVFVGPHHQAKEVYVVHTMEAPDFTVEDEDKVFVGLDTPEEAFRAFHASYHEPGFYQSMSIWTFENFKEAVYRMKGKKLESGNKYVTVVADTEQP